VWPLLVAVPPPLLHPLLGIRHRQEPVLVQAFLPEPAVERLHDGVVRRLAGPDEVQHDPVPVRPLVEHPRRELRPAVHPQARGHASLPDHALEDLDHVISGQPEAYLSARLSRL
jgi:hypothetical protein